MVHLRVQKNALAAKTKFDEFYTRAITVRGELRYYRKHYRGSAVYMNADSPESEFVKYFDRGFEAFGLSSMHATGYGERGSYLTRRLPGQDMEVLSHPGDFRSPACRRILEECDVVVTNPPFSILREYFDLVYRSGKKFLIFIPLHAFGYMDIFDKLKKGKAWPGITHNCHTGGTTLFRIPEDTPESVLGNNDYRIGGKRYALLGGSWITNMTRKAPPEREYKEPNALYSPKMHPRYDNYDAIEVSSFKNWPKNYSGIMGVPLSFFTYCEVDKYELLDCGTTLYVKGRAKFRRVLIRLKE